MQITLCATCAKHLQLEPKLELKVGNFYLSRDGERAVLITSLSLNNGYPFKGIILDISAFYTWSDEGSFSDEANHELDLIKEITHEEALKIPRKNNEKL